MTSKLIDYTAKSSDNVTLEDEDALIAAVKKRSQMKARLVTVLDRGIVNERLHVPLPPDKYGEWVPNDKVERYRMESLGFKVDTEYANKRALHDGGGGEAIVADCVFMVCDRDTKEIIEEIRREQYDAANSPRGGKQKEERDLEAEAELVGLPSKIKSRVDSANLESIKSALTSKD